MAMKSDREKCHFALPAEGEGGFVLIVALLMLAALTIIGIAATNTTVLEMHISGNDKTAKINFFAAESAALEAAQKVINESDEQKILPETNPSPSSSDLVRTAQQAETVFEKDKLNLDLNGDRQIDQADNFPSAGVSVANATVGHLVTLNGVESGSSLGVGSSRLYDYTAYGVVISSKGKKIVKVGLKKRF